MTAKIELFDVKFIVEFYIIEDFGTHVCPEQTEVHIESIKVYDSEIDVLPIVERIDGYKKKILEELNSWM